VKVRFVPQGTPPLRSAIRLKNIEGLDIVICIGHLHFLWLQSCFEHNKRMAVPSYNPLVFNNGHQTGMERA